MRAENQGKLMIALLVSVLAFGSGTGAALILGYYDNTNPYQLNLTKVGDFPYIQTTRPNINNNSNSQDYLEPNTPSQNINPSNNNNQNNKTNSTSNQV